MSQIELIGPKPTSIVRMNLRNQGIQSMITSLNKSTGSSFRKVRRTPDFTSLINSDDKSETIMFDIRTEEEFVRDYEETYDEDGDVEGDTKRHVIIVNWGNVENYDDILNTFFNARKESVRMPSQYYNDLREGKKTITD